MAPSQPNATSSPHPAHTAGPSTASSSTTSPTGTHSTVATTVGNRQRSWDEDKHLHLYILDYCRRRKFDETANAFEREARISPDSKINFEAPQGLLFEWWIVFWETFNSQRSHLAGPAGQGESSQVYVNTMARLKKLAMHEKDEQSRTRSMSMSMPMPGPMMGGMGPAMNGSGTASTMSTPAMGNMPNPMSGPRPPSQASARMPQQPGIGQPGNPPMGPGASGPGMAPQQGPGMQMNGPPQQGMGGQQPGMPQQQRPPQPGMAIPPGGMQMTPSMTHPSPHVSTPSAPHVSSTPSPVPTPPQTFSGPGPQQPFNPQFNQPQFQPGGPAGQPPFAGQPGQFPPGNQPQFRQGPGQNGPPQNAPFPPGGSGPGFQPGAGGPGAQNFGGQPGPGFPPGPGNGPGPQQFQSGPGGQFQSGPAGPGPGTLGPAGPGAPGGQFPGGRPGIPFQNGRPEWGQQPPPIGAEGRREGHWEDGRPRPGPGMMGQQPKMGASHPGMQQYLGRPGGPPHMMGQPGMGGPPMGGQIPSPSPKDDNRSVTPQQTQAGWNPEGANMQRRAALAAQGGQVGPGGRPGPGFNPQGPGPQKRPGSPPPPATTNLGGSPPDPKRPRPNDPGPGVLVDSRVGPDGRPNSSKGMPFQPGMNGAQQQRLNGEQQYSQELRSTTAEMRGQVLRQGGPQPPPFVGKGQQQNGRGSRPPDVPSPASGGEGPGQPRQVMNVKGQAGGSMGPPASPSLTNRMVGGVKKSDSAGNSPALPPSTVPNGMNPGDRSHTPQQMKADTHSPMPAPMRPQSAQPPTMNQGPSFAPAPTGSAPPMLSGNPSQSPNNMLAFDSKLVEPFDFGPGMGLSDFSGDFLSDMDPIFQMDNWPNDE